MVLGILFVVLLVLLIVAMVRPRIFLPKSKKYTRLKLAGIFLAALFVVSYAGSVIDPVYPKDSVVGVEQDNKEHRKVKKDKETEKEPDQGILSATIETYVDRNKNMFQTACVVIEVRKFRKDPQVGKEKSAVQAAYAMSKYARCTQNGEQLEQLTAWGDSGYFRKGKRCRMTLYYKLPDEDDYSGLRFDFDLPGHEISYEGHFENRKFRHTNGIFSYLRYETSEDERTAWIQFSVEGLTPIHSVTLISGDDSIEVDSILGILSYEHDTGLLPESANSLKDHDIATNTGIKCEVRKAPGFEPEKVRILSEEGGKAYYYNLKERCWE